MKRKSYKLFVIDMIDAINKIQKYAKDITIDEFLQNDLLIDAIIRNLEIIGEAAKYIPDDIRYKYSEIPWKRIIGMRNMMIHQYFGVDMYIVWTVVTVNLPDIKPFIEKMLKEIIE